MKSINIAILRYQIGNNALRAAAMYYAIMAAIVAGIAVLTRILGGSGAMHISNLEFNTTIFLFVYGINILKPDLKFFSANGLTRKQLYFSIIITGLVMSGIMLMVDSLFGFAYANMFQYENLGRMFQLVYPGSSIVQHVLFGYCYYVMMFMSGFLVSNIYYKLNVIGKVIVSVGVPGLLLVGIPILNELYFSGRLMKRMADMFVSVMGIYPNNNIMYGIAVLIVVSISWAVSSFLLMRRAILKYQ